MPRVKARPTWNLCTVMIDLKFDAVVQIMFTPYVELEVVPGLPHPAVIVVVVGDILIDGKVEEKFRETRMALLQNPSLQEIKRRAMQFQVNIQPFLWQKIVVR